MSGAATARRFAPALALALLAGAAAFAKTRVYDVWWHMAAGRLILSTASIPRADDFSFTSAGVAWVDHEWLFQAILYLLYAGLGVAGLWLLKALCAFGTVGLGWLAQQRAGGAVGLSLLLAALAAPGFRFRLTERPESVSLLMTALAAFLLLDLATRPGRTAARLGLLGAAVAVWANLHGGALLAPALAAACAAGAWLDRLRAGRGAPEASVRAARVASAAVGVCAAAVAVNPYGARIYLVPGEIAAALSPVNLVNPEWLVPSWSDFRWFYLAAAAVAAAAAAGVARGRPHAFARACVLLAPAALAATALRHIGVFFALVPVALDPESLPRRLRLLPPWAGAAAALASALAMAQLPPAGSLVGLGFREGRYPVDAADFVQAHMPDARLYNDAGFGGYLIWRGYPGRRVFLDGRNEVHAALLKEISRALDDGRLWHELMARHGVEGAIVQYRYEPIEILDAATGIISHGTFSEAHFPLATWALVHWDDVAMVYVRRGGRLSALAEGREYRQVRPEAWRLGQLRRETAPPAELLDEIRRKLTEDPDCQMANTMARVYGIASPAPPG